MCLAKSSYWYRHTFLYYTYQCIFRCERSERSGRYILYGSGSGLTTLIGAVLNQRTFVWCRRRNSNSSGSRVLFIIQFTIRIDREPLMVSFEFCRVVAGVRRLAVSEVTANSKVCGRDFSCRFYLIVSAGRTATKTWPRHARRRGETRRGQNA